MRKIKNPKIGEYVLVTRWSDKDPKDPWFVSYIQAVIRTEKKNLYRVQGSAREWNCCFRITKEEGIAWLDMFSRPTS
jgi:hypothetical protein